MSNKDIFSLDLNKLNKELLDGIEDYIDISETSFKDIIPVGRELKGGYEDGGTNYVILFYYMLVVVMCLI